jgi:hypothetical protein
MAGKTNMEIKHILARLATSTIGFFCVVLLLVFTATANEIGDTIGTVTIYGYRDGQTSEWLIGKGHRTSKATLIFCSTPSTKKDVRWISDKLGVDSANHSHMQICYVIRNKGTLTPGVLLKSMMLKISRKNPQNIYCLEKDDEYTILWGKIERSARMSIIDNLGLVLFAEYLPMQEDDFLRAYKIIKSLQ